MNFNKKKAVIFDCDGVMFDSRQANINFYNRILEHFGLPPMTADKIDFVHTHTADESIGYLFQGTDHTTKAQEFRLKIDYSPFIKDMVIEQGLKELLTRLKPRFGLAVATSRSNTIGNVLESFGLDKLFDIVVSSLDVSSPKPHPESLFKIMEFFGIGPGDSLYVGDSMVDYKTARAAGVKFISFKNPALEADYHADSMGEIRDIAEGYLLDE